MPAARSRATTISWRGICCEVEIDEPKAWFIATKKRMPTRFWIDVWSRFIWK